ncbi:MAG TPA: hypothetical protein VNF47_14920 [Streptosporangiaceae bacterium]|nr:hypothetical protein [Streptosporangiaceae bacterium]
MNATQLADPATDAMFDVEVVDRLEPQHIRKLAAGVLGAVRIRDFFSAQDCADVMDRLEDCDLGAYDEQFVQPRVAKLGPAAYDYYDHVGLTADYWAAAEHSAAARSTLLRGADPLTRTIAKLRDAWQGDVRPATSGGRTMFSGMIREINQGARLHFDEVVREFPGVLDNEPFCQLAFNCYLSMPPAGGESVVYRRRWKPRDEDYRDGYGYDQCLVTDEPVAEVLAETGDGMFFDCRNYHLVRSNIGAGRRVTLSFFVGISASRTMQIWS